MSDKIIIFTDGSSKGNPGPGGWAAVVIQNNSGELKDCVTELGGFDKHTTNNRMELTGAIEALEKILKRKEDISIYTDSKYLINGMTGWIYGWQKNNWQTKEKKQVLNQDLWKRLAELAKGKKINWHYVGGHVGIAGNERCDEIADALATGGKVVLYDGDLENYKIDIMNMGHDEVKKEVKNNKGAKAYSYLSLVNGILNIDKTWAECEKRVKGKKGAKFKKAVSPDQEKEILESWGLNE